MSKVFNTSVIEGTIRGVRVVCQPVTAAPLAVFRLCFAVGGRHDPVGLSGLAHLCEHLLCQGMGESPAAIQRRIHQAGGESEGWTFHDRTCFAETLPPSRTEDGLWAVSQRLARCDGSVTAEQLRRERAVLIQERRQRQTVPLMTEIEALQHRLYPPDHPYHHPPAGLAEGLLAITVNDVVGFLQARYGPSEAVLAVAGAIDADRLMRRAEELLDQLPSAVPPVTAEPPVTPPVRRPLHPARVRSNGSQTRSYLAFTALGYGTEDSRMAGLLARALATGRSSPLQRLLAGSDGPATGVRAYVETMRDATTIAFSATARPGVAPEQLEAKLVTAVDSLLAGNLRPEALARARKMTLIEHYLGLERLALRVDRLVCDRLYAAAEPVVDLERWLQGIDLDRLLDWGRRHAGAVRRVTMSAVPQRQSQA